MSNIIFNFQHTVTYDHRLKKIGLFPRSAVYTDSSRPWFEEPVSEKSSINFSIFLSSFLVSISHFVISGAYLILKKSIERLMRR